jgi:hypothetical protein
LLVSLSLENDGLAKKLIMQYNRGVLQAPALASISEACAIAQKLELRTMRRLDRDAITPRQLRYLEQRDILRPSRPTFDRQVDGRLYDSENIALVRIWLRLLAEVGEWATSAALSYLGNEVRSELNAAFKDGITTDAVLVMRGVRGVVVPSAEAERMPATYKLRLVEVVRGVDEALASLRRAEPEIFTGRRREAGSTLATEILRG